MRYLASPRMLVLGVLCLAGPLAAETASPPLELRSFKIRSAGANIPFQCDPKHLAQEESTDTLNTSEVPAPVAVFNGPIEAGELVIGDITVSMDADRILWNEDPKTLPAHVDVFPPVMSGAQYETQMRDVTGDGVPEAVPFNARTEGGALLPPDDRLRATLPLQTNAQFFQQEADGRFTLRDADDLPEAVQGIRVNADVGEGEHLNLSLERYYISGRAPLEGATLDAGPPIFSSRTTALQLSPLGNAWSAVAFTANPLDASSDVYLLLLRRRPADASERDYIAQFSVEAKFLELPEIADWPHPAAASTIVVHKIENGKLSIPPPMDSLPEEAELLSAPRVTTFYTDARRFAEAQGIAATTLFKIVLRQQHPMQGGWDAGAGGFGGGGSAIREGGGFSGGSMFGGGRMDGVNASGGGSPSAAAQEPPPISRMFEEAFRYFYEGSMTEKTYADLPPGFAVIADTASNAETPSLVHGILALVYASRAGAPGRSRVDFYGCYRTEAVMKRKKILEQPKNYWMRASYECATGDTVALIPDTGDSGKNLAILVTLNELEPSPSNKLSPF